MKKQKLLILAAIILGSCTKPVNDVYLFSYFKGNGQDGLHIAYSYDGLKFTSLKNDSSFLTPTTGVDKLMRDPCVIKGGDGKFHMVWTVSWNEKGIGYANSEDLINWSEQKYIPVMEHEPEARNCWAPEIFYDENEDIYMIYWATSIPGHFTETDSTAESGYNHRMYYTTTSDFKTFSDTKLFYDQGFNVIDATIQKSDSNYVMFLKDETKYPEVAKNIRIATSKNLTGEYTEASAPISRHWVEGPTVLHANGEWIIYYDCYREHHYGAIKSTDLENWTDITDSIQFPEGTRHGTIFSVDESVLNKLLNQ